MKFKAIVLAALLILTFLLCACGGADTESKASDVPSESAVSQSAEIESAESAEHADAESSEAATGEVIWLVSKKTETVSGNNSVTTYEYDDSGLLIKKTLVSGNNTSTHEYAYNENGATVSDRYKSSAEEYTTMIEYDANGNVIKEYVKENPGSYTLAEYDSEGRKAKHTVYQNGKFSYNVVYTYADGKAILVSEGVNFGKQTGIYDAETKLLLELMTEDLHRTKEYDEHGNVVKVVQEKDGVTTTQVYSYEYSEDGKMLKKNDPSGTTVYEYDDNGNLLSEITTDGAGKESSRIEYEYVSIQIES